MNSVSFYFLNKLNNPKDLDSKYLEDLYEYYEYGSQELHYDVNIEREEFQEVFRIIFSILQLKLSNEDFEIVANSYLKLLMADARDGNVVDIKWFIDHAWYLCVGAAKHVSTDNYKDCILFIQKSLIERFGIEENIKEKFKRKICTSVIINI